MTIKTLFLAAALALAAPPPLAGSSPNLASYNPSDTETEIYKSSPYTPGSIYRSDDKHSPSDYAEIVSASSTPTTSAASAATPAAAACTSGPPASSAEDDNGGFTIDDYTKVLPSDTNSTSYEVEKSWYKKHFVSGPHWFGYNHAEGQFGAWKCQFTCNAAGTSDGEGEGECNGYFVWYESVGTQEEHMKCVLFDAVIPESVLVPTNATGTMNGGAYDRICKTHVKST
ncbi:hypothetical protein B0T21DRAFT_290446 [Apiosordaria backusii]|uniref:Uncharacterized protein n=1 Tax=Apiosordaria backusii TaxID=314023 RepID=A0AA40EH33_9PEZI|nr:hypothetical protein B0T21DRAFT_290446 [Apiosordaria backusii]